MLEARRVVFASPSAESPLRDLRKRQESLKRWGRAIRAAPCSDSRTIIPESEGVQEAVSTVKLLRRSVLHLVYLQSLSISRPTDQ